MKPKNIFIIVSLVLILVGVKVIFLKPKNQGKPNGAGAMGKGGPTKVTAFITSGSTSLGAFAGNGTAPVFATNVSPSYPISSANRLRSNAGFDDFVVDEEPTKLKQDAFVAVAADLMKSSFPSGQRQLIEGVLN
jgi:hypothetical protein